MSDELIKRSPICRTFPPRNYAWRPPPLNVVFQFCARDYSRAIKLLQWSAELKKQTNNELHLVTDEGFRCDGAVKIAQDSWKDVVLHRIKPSSFEWPICNNYAFAETCHIMRQSNNPWLLWETDMIPAKVDWLQELENEYTKAQKPFMGAWVDYLDILNGGSIYPPDIESWCPDFFNNYKNIRAPYDCVIAPDIIWFVHPANHMMPNIFNSRPNGRPAGMIDKIPVWTQAMFDWVCTHHVCLIHRDKSGVTIDFLRKRLGISK